MRLIDADALKRCIGCEDAVKYGNKSPEQQHDSYSTMMMYEIADYIDDAPDIDAVPVVRCKDCVHWRQEVDCGCGRIHWYCTYMRKGKKPDEYCSRGEKKEDEAK